MPELVEVERYRRLAEGVVGRTVFAAEVPDPWIARDVDPSVDLASVLVGRRVASVHRHGKLLVVSLGGGPTLGLRFGMTGTLVVDGEPGVDRLLRSPPPTPPATADLDRWVRFRLRFARPRGGQLALRDPRRLGRVVLDPDEGALGPDAAAVTVAELAGALRTTAPLKVRLQDQSKLAGIGNLMADEILWRAGLSPVRPAGCLSPAEVRRLHRHLRATVDDLVERGGSHAGDLMAQRRPGGRCPRDGHELVRSSVGGRTSWWCPAHQR